MGTKIASAASSNFNGKARARSLERKISLCFLVSLISLLIACFRMRDTDGIVFK